VHRVTYVLRDMGVPCPGRRSKLRSGDRSAPGTPLSGPTDDSAPNGPPWLLMTVPKSNFQNFLKLPFLIVTLNKLDDWIRIEERHGRRGPG
jgi:hypothetical protein